MEPSARAFLALAMLVLATAPSGSVAEPDAVMSGDNGLQRLPVASVTLDGVLIGSHDGGVQDVEVRFVMSAAGAITQEGTTIALAAGDDFRLGLFSGQLRLDPEGLSFAGSASEWVLCSADLDEDGLLHCDELEHGTDPALPDTDDDGLLDGEEVFGTRNPYPPAATDPLVADTDGDSLADGPEVDAGTDPNDQDTDDGGEPDGAETFRGSDPLDGTDDYYGVYASLERQGAASGTPLPVEWVGVDPHTSLQRGNHSLSGVDLTVQHDQGQWIMHNGTETYISNGFRFTLFDFRGEVAYTSTLQGNGTQDILSFAGVARNMEVRNITNEHEAVRTKVIIEQDASEGKLRLTTFLVVDDQPVQPSQQAEVGLASPVPVYAEFDTWKGHDLTEVGVYHISMDAAEHEGVAGYWLIVYNEDPVLYQSYVPFRAPLFPFSSLRLCIMTEAPFWCGGFEQW